MNNKKIFFILIVILAILYIGLEIVPNLFKEPFEEIEFKSSNVKLDVMQKSCLKCHSMKYDDNFKYDKSFYEEVQNSYENNPPKDISLLDKRFSIT